MLAHVHCEGAVTDMLACMGLPGPTGGILLDAALQGIMEEGLGVVVCLCGKQAHGVSLSQEVQSLAAGGGPGRVAAGYTPDLRDYGLAAQILRVLKASSIRLLADDSRQLQALRSCGLKAQQARQQGHANGASAPKLGAQTVAR